MIPPDTKALGTQITACHFLAGLQETIALAQLSIAINHIQFWTNFIFVMKNIEILQILVECFD